MKFARFFGMFIVLCVSASARADGTVALPECTKGENDSGLEWRTVKQVVHLTLNTSNFEAVMVYEKEIETFVPRLNKTKQQLKGWSRYYHVKRK